MELRKKAPNLLAILQAAAQATRSRKAVPSISVVGMAADISVVGSFSVVGMAAGILLKTRNKHMCALQSVVSTLLYAGHASKKVSTVIFSNHL